MTTCKRSRVGRSLKGAVVLKDFSRLPGSSLPDDRFASASLVRNENSERESKVILSSIHVHMYRPASVCTMNCVYRGEYLVKTDTSAQHISDIGSRPLSFASVQPHIKILSPSYVQQPNEEMDLNHRDG